MKSERTRRLHTWVLLHYKIPREPTAPRVAVWRKLKRLGAVLRHDAVWILPATASTRENFQWLAAEIAEGGGEATIWEAHLADAAEDAALVQEFLGPLNAEYEAILKELTLDGVDVAALARRYQHVRVQDYLHSEYGERVREALMRVGGVHATCSG